MEHLTASSIPASQCVIPPKRELQYHKRLRKWEAFDRIEFKVVPRHKESGLSGDEWRTSVHVCFYFKDIPVYEINFRDMQAALLMIGHHWVCQQGPIPEEVIKIEKEYCDQPGCSEKHNSIKRYLKRETAPDGSYIDPDDTFGVHYRLFCNKHSNRGDCSREDSEDNYTVFPPSSNS